MTINPERAEDLIKLATADEAIYEILSARPYQRPNSIEKASRLALGLAPEIDINNLNNMQQEELLFVMRTIRDTIYPTEDRGLPWK